MFEDVIGYKKGIGIFFVFVIFFVMIVFIWEEVYVKVSGFGEDIFWCYILGCWIRFLEEFEYFVIGVCLVYKENRSVFFIYKDIKEVVKSIYS